MIQAPEAPLPPPPPHHPGMDAGVHHLGVDMDRLNLGHGIPQYSAHSGSHNPSFDGQFPAHNPQFDTSLPLDGSGKVPVAYEGWTFTKEVALRPDQKETWAKVVKRQMSAPQATLREVVAKQKNKRKSVMDQLSSPEMKGYKRQQIDRLITDRTRTDPDPRFEYKLAALKLEQGRNNKGRETVEMRAILKRQLRSGYAQPSISAHGRMQAVEGEIVDLTGAEDTNYSQDSYSTGASGPYPHSPPHGYAQPFVEHVATPFVHDARFTPQPPYVHTGQPTMEQFAPPQGGHQLPHEGYETPKKDDKKHDKKGKKDEKEKVKLHQKKDKNHKSYSDSSSEIYSDADSFESKAYTDRTPDTIYSGKSDNRYHEDKKRGPDYKESRHQSNSHHRNHSPTRRVYRERHRKSPTRSSGKGSTRYEYEDYDVITAERPRDRDRSYDTGRKGGHSYEHERPLPPRALSFDDDRHHRTSYVQPRRLQSHSYTAELHAEKEGLKWEIEELKRQKHVERLEREKNERDRLELRRLEMEAERQERADRDRLDRLHRDRYHRDRYERSTYAEPLRRSSTFDSYRRDDPYYM